MIEQLEIRTLSFITVFFCHFFGVGLIIFSKTQKELKGITVIGSGILILGCGFLFISFRNFVDMSLSVLVANILIFLGVVIISEGLFQAGQYQGKLKYIGRMSVIILPVLIIYYTYIDVSVNNRIVIISAFLSVQFFICAVIILMKTPESDKIPYVLTSAPLIFAALFFVLRGVVTLNESRLEDFMKAGLVHSLAFVVIELVVIGLSFGIVWIANSRLQKKLTNLVRIDPLTSILNRRGLEEIILKITTLMIREKQPLSSIMIDIDHFKKINDTFGHQAGDEILKQFSGLLKDGVRASDIIARYGGEEFIIVLPDTDIKGALNLAEKLRKQVERHSFNAYCVDIKLTASFGVSSNQEVIDWESLISESDEALYIAKRDGRNRVEKYTF